MLKSSFWLVDSRRQLDEWHNGTQTERNLNLSIPLLMQNKVPDGFEDGDGVKVDLRPESVSMHSYVGQKGSKAEVRCHKTQEKNTFG